MLFSWKGGIRLIDEDVSRRTIAVSIKATKLTGRVLAQACLAVGRKIKKAHRARQTPHGKQTVRQLMGHGAATNSIEVESPKAVSYTHLWGDAWTPPLPEVAVILLIVVSSVILAVHGPIKRIRNM